jgi:hypothetical protein
MPPLHNRIFGGAVEDVEWAGRFVFQPSTSSWLFMYLQYYDPQDLMNPKNDITVPELQGRADTPRDAFEDCVSKFIWHNDSQESPTLKTILPLLRPYFNEDGGVKLEHFFAGMQ